MRAEGIYIWDSEGRRIIDGLAGLGCVTIGYGRRELAAAAAQQMEQLSFSQSFFKTTNEPAIRLAEKLVALTPAGLNHVFYSTSGSEANETSLKLARRYWTLRGKPEKRVAIARGNAYHGSTIAMGSLSGLPHAQGWDDGPPLPGISHIGAPYWYLHGAGQSPDDFGLTAARWLEEKILALGAETVAVFFAEPMQGAGGAIIPPDTYWPEIQRICRQYDILLAVDEVVTGFGRAGTWFGCEAFGITRPDLLALAKGITSSYFPLSATLVSDPIADLLIREGGEFYHGFTNSGHPVGCAVALENLRIMEDEGLIAHAAAIAPHFANGIAQLGRHPLVGDARAKGLLAGLQLVADKEARQLFDEHLHVGDLCSTLALDRGLALRAIGDTMALMPPLTITIDQLDEVFAITRAALDAVAASLGSR